VDSLDAFELVKHGSRSNANARLHDTPLISYGRVIKVIDIHTVMVEVSVKTSSAVEAYIVPLLSLSSALLELNAYPRINDKVLLLFLQKFDPDMFTSDDVIENMDAAGYNAFSGVGILLTTFRGYAKTVIKFLEDGKTPIVDLSSDAEWGAVFNSAVGITFCRAVFDSEDEEMVNVLFGQGRPLMERFLSGVTKEYGFHKDNEGNLIKLDAAVTERYSQYAPITKNVQGMQTVTIGVDDDNKDTDAAVSVKIGAKADIDINSKSGKKEKYTKDVSVESSGKVSIKAAGVVINTTASVEIKNTADTLGGLIDELFSEISTALNTAIVNIPATSAPGTPSAGTTAVNPTSAVSLAALKARFKALLK